MTDRTFALVSAIGGRAAHRMISRAFGQPFYDAVGAPAHTQKRLGDELEMARYYFWANLIRGAIYIPVLIGLQGTGHLVSLGAMYGLVAFHAICVAAELYKLGAIRRLLAGGRFASAELARTDPLPAPAPHPYFTPKRFETERAYRLLGLEIVRKLVNFYIDHTQLTPEQRRAGKKAQQMEPTRNGVVKYETTTRQAETMHLLAASFNLAPLISFLVLGKAKFAVWVGFILFVDVYLVLLQRYHRVRVMSRWNRIMANRSKAAAS